MEFYCDRLKDHYSILPHSVVGLLALVGYMPRVGEGRLGRGSWGGGGRGSLKIFVLGLD